MFDLYLASVIVFIVLLVVVVYRDRKKFTREFILLLRKTKRGRGFLIKTGTLFPGFWKALGVVGVIIGFVISVWISYSFLMLTADNIMKGAGPGLSLVLPSASAEAAVGPGYLAVPFWYWVIVIACLVLVHEGLHGIMAAAQRVRIRSLGWGLLLVIPLAFVEPDEKQLERMGSWIQLRVFAAGSFANFMLAGVAFLLLSGVAFSLYTPMGVAFRGYPGSEIAPAGIQSVDGYNVTSIEGLRGYLGGLDNSTLLRLTAGNGSYYANAGLLLAGLDAEKAMVFDDFDAVKVNLTGTIIRVGDFQVSDDSDLREALDKLGPGKQVEVTTRDEEGNNQTVELVLKEEPPTVFTPDSHSLVVFWFEQFIPGTIDALNGLSEWGGSVWGAERIENWRTIDAEISLWAYARDHYPLVSQRAGNRIDVLRAEQAQHPRAGFLGIASVSTFFELKGGLEGQKPLIEFLNGLLFWMFLINFGVGAFNLLPIRILDGGRMWEIVMKKLSRRYYRDAIRAVSAFTLFLLLLNFVIMAGIPF